MRIRIARSSRTENSAVDRRAIELQRVGRPHPCPSLVACALTALLAGAMCHVAQADDYSIPWYTVSSGGGQSAGGEFTVMGTIGETAAGTTMAGGDYAVSGGYWVPEVGAPGVCYGDSNCDGNINWRDIDFFVAAQNDNVSAWIALHEAVYGTPPVCPFENNDVDGSGSVSWRDIDPFVALQNTTCP